MNKTSFFEYSCRCWDGEVNGMRTFHGVVYADSFSHAMQELDHYYDMVENVHLQVLNPCNVYEFEEGTVGFTLIVDEKGEVIKDG